MSGKCVLGKRNSGKTRSEKTHSPVTLHYQKDNECHLYGSQLICDPATHTSSSNLR